ncbi:MAG: hypothetical protein AB7Q97_17615 [Gammaproteobacteria bacterium]
MRQAPSERHPLTTAAVFMTALASSGAAPAATIGYSGTVTTVVADSPGTVFEGVSIGQIFQGQAAPGDSAAEAVISFNGPDETNYVFPPGYAALVGSGATSATLTDINVNVQNDHAATADEAALVNEILGTAIAAGTLIDTWSLIAFSPGAGEIDLTPGDGDDTESLVGGLRVEIAFVSLDTTLFASTDYVGLPPLLGGDVFGAFFIDEADGVGDVLFSAYGRLDSAGAVVPLPPALALLAPALGVFACRRRRHGDDLAA